MSHSEHSATQSRTHFLAGLLGTLAIGGMVLFVHSPVALLGVLCLLLGCIALYFGYEYLPLVLFLLLPFSVELQVTTSTRLTVPTELLIPLLFVLFFFITLVRGKIVYRSSPLNVAVFLLYAVMVGSLVYSPYPISTLKAIIRDTGYIVAGYYLIPMYVTSEKRLKHLVYGGLFFHTLLVLYGFGTQAVLGLRIYGDIATPFFVEHCIYAAYITITFCFLLAYLLDYESRIEFPWLPFITMLFTVGIALTFVRAAWLSVIALLLFYLIQFRQRKAAVNLIVGLILTSFLGISVMMATKLGTVLLTRISTIPDLNYVANFDRIDRWITAWNIWKDYLFFGSGWGTYPDMYFWYQSGIDAFSRTERMGAHNLYLELMAEAGIVGLSVYLLLIYQFFRQSLLVLQRVKTRFQQIFIIGVQGSMVTYLVHAYVNNLGPSDKIGITFWFLLGIVPTLNALADEKE
jgi:putative inorganic carbon (hco3(-)) transporter